MSRLVFVNSIPRDTATGINDWVNTTSGVKMNKVKIGRCNDKLRALYSVKQGGLANYISYTPWIENGVPVVEDGTPLMLQTKLERKWNKPNGYFTNEPATRGDVNEEKRTYFQRKVWPLNDGSTVLDLSTMDGEMGYYVMLASSRVANSEKEWKMHLWPKAEWYIALENESDQIKYQKNSTKVKAFAALENTELTPTYKRKLAVLLELIDTKTVVTNEQLENILFEYIDKSTYIPGSNIDKFNELYKLLSTATGREEFEARFLLKQAIDVRIVYEKQGTYTWVRAQGQIVLGDRFRDAISFILNPKKADEVEELTEAIKVKLA